MEKRNKLFEELRPHPSDFNFQVEVTHNFKTIYLFQFTGEQTKKREKKK